MRFKLRTFLNGDFLRLLRYLYDQYCLLGKRQRRQFLAFLDSILFCFTIYIAFWLRFETPFPLSQISDYARIIFLLIAVKLLVFETCGVYRAILRYSNWEFLNTITKAVFLSSGSLVFLAYLSGSGSWPLPRSVLIIDAFLTLFCIIGFRLLIKKLLYKFMAKARQSTNQERLVIYGAGSAGSQLVRALVNDKLYKPVAFVDDDPDLQNGTVVEGLKVYSAESLYLLWERKSFDTVVVAIPSLGKRRKLQIVERLQAASIPIKTIPSISEIISGKVSIQKLRNIDITDLLGREEVQPNLELLSMQVKGKVVLVTGAGGSIGSELCRQIAEQQPKCLILYELSEFALYNIDMELAETYPQLQRVACLGNVTNAEQMSTVFKDYQVETVYHAAAYKHVPLVENNVAQGIENNVLGTLTAARCAMNCGVRNFVMISTDKAVRPTNVMGASKRVAELVVQALAKDSKNATKFVIVRFGNVLNSSGSVVPRFRKQIAEGQPITLTHQDITRYFMTIPEAARLVMQAGSLAQGGEVFLLDMGEPVRIYDLAVQMIRLSGLVPGEDIEVKITGLRPGEKLYEELLISGDNVKPTRHPKIFCAEEYFLTWETLQSQLKVLFDYILSHDRAEIVNQLRQIVPEYQPKNYPSKVNPLSTSSSNRELPKNVTNLSDFSGKMNIGSLR